MRTRWFTLSLIPLFLLAAGLLLFAIPARAQDGVCENASVDGLEASVFPIVTSNFKVCKSSKVELTHHQIGR